MDDLEGLDFNIRIDNNQTTPAKDEAPDLWRDDSDVVSSPVLVNQDSTRP